MASDLYTVPAGLDSVEFRAVLAARHPEISDQHYLANGCLCHTYTDRSTAAQVRVVRSPTSGVPAEIVGDGGLWLRIRDLALTIPRLHAGTGSPLINQSESGVSV